MARPLRCSRRKIRTSSDFRTGIQNRWIGCMGMFRDAVTDHVIRNVTRLRAIGLVALAITTGCMRAHVPAADGTAGGDAAAAFDIDETADYDPWQPFNEKMFTFNHDILDRWLVKPVATAWDTVIPRPARRGFARALDNLDMPRRLVNNLLQARPLGAGREVARFVVNTTAGGVGLFDVASAFHLDKSDADTGETLAL